MCIRDSVNSPAYPEFLQWFHYCEGMVMPPINTIVVQTKLLSPERRNAEVLGQAQRLLSKALSPVDAALTGREYLIGAFSAADVMLGHASFMSRRLDCVPEEMTALLAYIAKIESRPAFQNAIVT